MTENNNKQEIIATEAREEINPYWRAINWNIADTDMISKEVFNKLVTNFWVPERIPTSNDIPTWNTLTPEEKTLTMRVFTGLTMLDTIQSRFGATSLLQDAKTQFEEAVYANITFMEAVHAKSYSNIFSTLANTEEINKSFRWSEENPYLQEKARIIMSYYKATDETLSHPDLRRKIASVFLESFLFYSGFYLPLHFSGNQKLINTADIIKLIIRDEAVHGFYIGVKFQESFNEITDLEVKEEITNWAYDLMDELYANEVLYTQDLYDGVPTISTEEVKAFLRYNANKALQNLGFEDPLFPAGEVNPIIINQLASQNSTIDFFSQAGANYALANVEEIDEDTFDAMDW